MYLPAARAAGRRALTGEFWPVTLARREGSKCRFDFGAALAAEGTTGQGSPVKAGGQFYDSFPFIIPHMKQAISLATAALATLAFEWVMMRTYLRLSLSFALSA